MKTKLSILMIFCFLSVFFMLLSCKKEKSHNSYVKDKALWSRFFADVDGDGKSDMVWRIGKEINVSLSTGSSFSPSSVWTNWSTKSDVNLADVNGDGAVDLIGILIDNEDISVALSTGTNFKTPNVWTQWNPGAEYSLADVNGDGMDDLIGLIPNNKNLYVFISDGNSFLPPSKWIQWTFSREYHLADCNGDGKADIVGQKSNDANIYVALSTGKRFLSSVIWGSMNPVSDYYLADVNGDERDDLIEKSPNDGKINVAISTGNSFLHSVEWSQRSPNADYKMADFNGDNKDDIIWKIAENFEVGESTGTNFKPSSKWSGVNYSITPFIDQLSTNNLREHLNKICSFGSRADLLSLSNASSYIESYFKDLGYQVTREKVIYDETWGYNIVATKIGNLNPNSYIEITAHYDGVNSSLQPQIDSISLAAKDNAAGVACILDIARVLRNYNNQNSFRFIAFAAEEKDKTRTGSILHVLSSLIKSENLKATLNIDTPGTGNPVKMNPQWNYPVQDEHYNVLFYRCKASYELAKLFQSVVKAYKIPLSPEIISPGTDIQSDELAYANHDQVAISSLGDWSNSFYHSYDNPRYVNYDNVLWIAQANMALAITIDH